MSALDGIKARGRAEGCEAHDTCKSAYLDRLVAAVEAVERTAKYLDTLAPGDQHYAKLFRGEVAKALGEAS